MQSVQRCQGKLQRHLALTSRRVTNTQTKCSGEKTGCNRCKSLDIQCIYTESRVGRVPGVRAKRKQNTQGHAISRDAVDTTATQSAEPRTAMGNDTIELNFGSFSDGATTDPARPRSPVPESFDDVVLNWPTDLIELGNQTTFDDIGIFSNSNDLFAGLSQNGHPEQMPPMTPDESTSSSGGTFSQRSHDFHASSPGFDAGDPRPQLPLNNQRPFSPPASASSSANTGRSRNSRTDSQCVLACSHMILSLEKYLADELKVLDLILGIVKRVVDALGPFVEIQVDSRNTKCLSLFSIIMCQIIELVEMGCDKFLAEEREDDLAQSHLDPLGGGLGFGAFGNSAESQRRWRSQTILQELHPIAKLLQKIATLSPADPSTDGGRANLNLDVAGSHRKLQASLEFITDRVKRGVGL